MNISLGKMSPAGNGLEPVSEAYVLLVWSLEGFLYQHLEGIVYNAMN